MKINCTLCTHRLRATLVALIVAAGPFISALATGTPVTGTIRYTGTDFEGRQNFQLEWNTEASGTYRVQSADDLPASNHWQTIDSVTSSNAGPVKWMAPEALRAQRFYRLVLPQPQIFSVEPGVVDTTVSGQFLYLLGQDLPTNADVIIDGVHFTPELINSNGVWARILLNGLPPGDPALDLTVVDLNTTNTVADFSHPFYVADSSTPYLLEPPSLPPAAPQADYRYYKKRKFSAMVGADDNDASARRTGEVCDDGNDPGVMAFSGEVQQQVADLAIAGRGLDFVWARTYRSRTTSANSVFGPHWTGSYDISVQPLGGDVVIHDGTGRADTYFLQTNGTYACPGFFREGTLSNNVFRLTFADGGTWEFNPFDGTATAGLLAHVMNGNGDIISLYRDGSGRLAQVVDDLGRTNTVSYNSDGQLAGITDFSGRTVAYRYYQMGEIGGSPGDLKSVTSPPVTGTPNGNDFPDGKTTTYTYSSGSPDESENHLLTSVADAFGTTTAQYDYDLNPASASYLRCVAVQRWTNTPAIISYLPQVPSPANQFAVMRCVLNDPEGNVTECFYDARNRCVTERDYTGRSVPGVAVTDVDNRPTGKLRSGDPDFYETRWTWNDDSLCTSVARPDGSSDEMVYQRAFNQNSSRSNHTHASLHDGDLRVIHEYPADGQAVDMDGDGVADTAERVWRFEYDPRFGSDPTAKPGKKLYVGNLPFTDSAPANLRDRVNQLEQSLKNLGLLASARSGGPGTTTGSFDPTKWQPLASAKNIGLHVSAVSGQSARDRVIELEAVLKNIGLLARTGGNVGINEPMPYAILHAAASGKRFGIGDTTPQGPLGWDGTINGCLSDGDCDDNDPKRHHPTAACLPGAFVTTMQDPRGNATTATYDSRGNTLHVTRPASDPQSDVEDYAYNAYGQVTTVTNAPDANGYRRVDTFNYYTSGPQAGYLQSIAIDEPGVHLTTSFEHDSHGNVTRCVDPRGNDWLYTYNALDQCVRCESPTNLTARCATDIYYDAADNVQGAIEEVRDDADAKLGSRAVNAEYDPLHRLTQIACDVDATHAMTNRFVYDGNDRCVQALGGDAVSGADPNETLAYQYDERGLLFREISAPGSLVQSTTQWDYDSNGNMARVSEGLEGTPSIMTMEYDGFAGSGFAASQTEGPAARLVRKAHLWIQAGAPNNRISKITDPMGNETDCFFDANDNLKTIRCFGETNDVPGSAGNLRLAEEHYDYDGLDRCVRAHALHFDPATQLPVGDGEATTTFAYAPNGECVGRTNDLGHVTAYGYDTAGRLTSVTSPEARTTFAVLLDGNGNATNCTETDLSDLGGAPQVFTVSAAYDSQNRCVQTMDNVGNTSSYSYDSLDRCVKTVDPRGTRAFYAYDLLDRGTAAIGDLDGDGSPDFTGDITESATWSSSSDRLLSMTDSHTNTTSYSYDTLGNCTNVSYADGTQTKLVWSPRSNLISEEDANGSVVSNTYDLNERIIHRDLAARNAVVAATTTFETFTYDGCSRLTSHHDDDCDGYLAYDSLGNCTSESLNGLPTVSTYDAVGNRLSLAFPGGRTLNYTYDALERRSAITDSGKSLASYSYDGPDRVSRVVFDNGTATRIFYDGDPDRPNVAGDYGWKQVSRVAHGLNGGSAIADSTYEYDPDQNKIFRSVTVPAGSPLTNEMAFQYDLANRLTEALVTDNSALTRDTVYGLDRMGNRTNVTGAACSGAYTLDGSALGPLDFQMNQYTATPCDARTYDDNGNLTSRVSAAGVTNYSYDAGNRLVSVQTLDFSSGVGTIVPVADYRYDALGRRISKTVYSGGASNVTQFLYDGDRVIEERRDGAVSTTYLVDDRHLLGLRASGKDYYLHCDDQGNALALTDAQGAVVERYEYDDYGAITFLASDGTPTSATSSAYGNVYLFGGLRYDAETGLDCDDRGGYLDPESGRPLARAGSYVPGSTTSVVFDYRGTQARTGEYVGGSTTLSASFAGNNPWSGGGAGGSSGGGFSEHPRDYLYGKFQDGDIPTQSDRGVSRDILKGYFETGDIPTQEQFSSLLDSAVNLNLQPFGGNLPIHSKVSRAILKTCFLTGQIPTQD